MTGERDSQDTCAGSSGNGLERGSVSSTRPRAVLHIRSPISWLFLHDVVGNIQLSESSETAAGRNDGWGRGNRSGATRVPQFSKVKVLRIVTDLGRTKVFVLHHRNARHKRGFNPKAVGRSGVAKTNRGEKKPSRLGESAFQISFKAAHMALAYLFKYHRENIFIVLSSGRQGRRATHRGRTWSGRRAGTRQRKDGWRIGTGTHLRQTYFTDVLSLSATTRRDGPPRASRSRMHASNARRCAHRTPDTDDCAPPTMQQRRGKSRLRLASARV